MAVNPLSFTDIGWFVHLTGRPLSPWEVEMIERMDDAALGATSQSTPPASRGASEPIPASNVVGIRALLRSKAAERSAGA